MDRSSVMLYDISGENLDGLKVALQDIDKVYIVKDEKEAIRHLIYTDVDLIIVEESKFLDEFLKFVELNKCQVPIVCITQNFDDDNVVKLYEKGFSEVFCKPFSEKIINIKLKNLILNKWNRDNINNKRLSSNGDIAKSRSIIIIAMSILAESRDGSTGQHIFQMQKVTSVIARKYREMFPRELSEKELEEIILFAPLHDIGKISIPDEVLKKPSKFNEEDMEIMKNHTLMGENLLLNTQRQLGETVELLRVAIEIAKYHHEKYDGTGYPLGLVGDEIPLSARIVAIADIYDALMSPRVYKKGFKHNEVVDIIIKGDSRISRNHFDPKVLEAFKATTSELKHLY